MKRRDILKYTAIASGMAISAPLILSLSSCKSDGPIDQAFTSSFFNPEEFEFVKELVDLILPKTDSPSASEVGVHQTIDEMLDKVYTKEEQEAYYKNFKALYEHLNQGQNIDPQHVASLENHSESDIESGFKAIKQQTVAYYLSTEVVGKQFLNYLPLPGEYEGCIELADVGGKAWTL